MNNIYSRDTWKLIVNMREDFVPPRGSIFRFPSLPPYGEYMDYMLCGWDDPFFVGITGPKAGYSYEKFFPDKDISKLTMGWICKNWEKLIYDGCGPEDVFYSIGFPTPDYPIHLKLRNVIGSRSS